MIGMKIKFQSDRNETAWPDLTDRSKLILLGNDAPMIRVVVLDKGMANGRPSVALRLDLPDGRSVIAETTGRLVASLGRMILARYPDLLEGEG